MDCKLVIELATNEHGTQWACSECDQRTRFTKTPPHKLHMACSPRGRKLKAGGMPGDKLKAWIERVGFQISDVIELGCGGKCQAYIDWMNGIGVEACKKNRSAIVKHLDDQKKSITWKQQLAAMFFAGTLAAQGIFIDPLDPSGWLFDRAIEDAEREAKSATADES